MPELENAAHEKFAKLVASGMRQSEAYGKIGYRPDTGNAAKLAGKPHIAERIAELRLEEAQRTALMRSESGTLEGTEELKKALQGAAAAGQWSAVVSAAKHLSEIDGSAARLEPAEAQTWEEIIGDLQKASEGDPVRALGIALTYVATSFTRPPRSETDLQLIERGLEFYLSPDDLRTLAARLARITAIVEARNVGPT